MDLEKINYNHLSPLIRTLRREDIEKLTGPEYSQGKQLFSPFDFFEKGTQYVKHHYTAKLSDITEKSLRFQYFLTPGSNWYYNGCFYLDIERISLNKVIETVFTFKDGTYMEVCRHEMDPCDSIREARYNKIQHFLKQNK